MRSSLFTCEYSIFCLGVIDLDLIPSLEDEDEDGLSTLILRESVVSSTLSCFLLLVPLLLALALLSLSRDIVDSIFGFGIMSAFK